MQIRDQRGMVLVISLLILALLLAAGIGAIVSVQTDLKTSSNFERGTQAFYVAEAGIHHARQELQDADGTNDFGQVYSASNAVIVSDSNFNGGAYTVTRVGSADNPQRIQILSEANISNAFWSRIVAWVQRDAGRPPKALETEKDLEIDGNPKILGTCGGAHSNADVKIDGNPTIQMVNGLTASKDLDIDGSPCIGSSNCGDPLTELLKLTTDAARNAYEDTNDDAPKSTIPEIKGADYAPYVAALGESGKGYILNNDGTIKVGASCNTSDGLCSGGTEPVTVPAGWSFSDGKWKVSGNSAANGVFYTETDVEISGNPGSASAPWQATIISRNDIKISGNPHIRPYSTTAADFKDHLFVAGDDLEITGNMKADYADGAILVTDEFKVDANPKIKGFVMVRGKTTIEKNMELTFNCNFGCLGPGCPPPFITTISSTEKF